MRGRNRHAALALMALALLAGCKEPHAERSRDGEAKETAANDRPYFPDLPKVQGAGDLPPEGDAVQRGQYVMTSGGGGGVRNACLLCHGVDGSGDAAGGVPRIGGMPAGGVPRIGGMPAPYLWGAMRAYAYDLRPHPVMTPIAKALAEDDWWTVSAYYASRRTAPGITPPAPERDLLTRGAILHAQGDKAAGLQPCAACHGPTAMGKSPIIPPLAGQHAAYTADQLRRWREGLRKDDPLASMRAVAVRLSDRDIDAVAAYYASLTAEWTGAEGADHHNGKAHD